MLFSGLKKLNLSLLRDNRKSGCNLVTLVPRSTLAMGSRICSIENK